MILWGQRATTNFVIKLLDNVGAETTLLDYSKFLILFIILFLILFSMSECLLMSLTCHLLSFDEIFYFLRSLEDD